MRVTFSWRMTGTATYMRSNNQNQAYEKGKEKVQLCARHCARYFTVGEWVAAFSRKNLKNREFLLVKKTKQYTHTHRHAFVPIILCQFHLFLLNVASLYGSLWKYASLWERWHIRWQSHYDVSQGIWTCQEGEIGPGISQIGREGGNQMQAGFPLLYKAAVQSFRERPNSNYYTLMNSEKLGDFFCMSLSQK